LASPVRAYDVTDIGSFHLEGGSVTLTGLPMREITYSPGSTPLKVDPNGTFEVEQMYVQYFKLAAPRHAARCSCGTAAGSAE